MRKKLFLILLFFGLLFVFGSVQTNSIIYYFEQINTKLINETKIVSDSQTPLITQPLKDGSVLLPEKYISANCINHVLEKADSPAKGTGEKWVEMGKKYNINPAVGLAFFRKESTFGKYGIATKTKSVGNIRCNTTNCYNGFNSYSTWEDGIEAWFKLISSKTYVASELDTVKKIIPKYAPSNENDTELYISQVTQWINEYNNYLEEC